MSPILMYEYHYARIDKNNKTMTAVYHHVPDQVQHNCITMTSESFVSYKQDTAKQQH